MEKVSIFVDVQNIYYTCRQAYKRSFDYNKFWAQATEGRELVGSCYTVSSSALAPTARCMACQA